MHYISKNCAPWNELTDLLKVKCCLSVCECGCVCVVVFVICVAYGRPCLQLLLAQPLAVRVSFNSFAPFVPFVVGLDVVVSSRL